MCDADGRITSGLVFVPVELNVFDDIGINHLPMNSGVASMNSPWLPLHSYYVHILVSRIVLFYYWFTSYRCMLVITLLLHMLYVI